MRAEMFTTVVGANVGRFLILGAIWGLSFVLPCQGQQTCEQLTIPLCQGLAYNTTIFPNMLNHRSQEEAALEVHQFFRLVKIGCSKDFAFFLSSVCAPICTVLKFPVPPCRSLCNSAKGACEDLMKHFGFTWPESLRCDRFPKLGDEICFGDRTSKTTHQPPTVKKGCIASLGMENGAISDAQITASSQWDDNHSPARARLNTKLTGLLRGGWSARTCDLNQWLQVDLGSYTTVTRVATQGRNGHDQWVTKYRIEYGNDGVNFHFYQEPGDSSPKVFNGNQDADSIIYNTLSYPITARYVRVRPVSWRACISMRMELYGCPGCVAPLGMEDGTITEAQITASSRVDGNHSAVQARLNFKADGSKAGAWSALTNNLNQWIQVDLGSYTRVTRVATQGRNAYNEWVTKYRLQYSDDEVNFQFYKQLGESFAKELNGNQDSDTTVQNKLSPPVTARYIRLVPVAWNNHISLRMEIYGCPGDEINKRTSLQDGGAVPEDKLPSVLIGSFVTFGSLALIATIVYFLRRKCHKESLVVGERIPPAGFRYDAFIIFSQKDQKWVDSELLRILEGNHGFKCCVHYRDFEVGASFLNNISNSFEVSHKVIAVASKHFFTSNWCSHELEQALYKQAKENDNSIIVIRKDDVTYDKLPVVLRKRSFIDYSNTVERKTWVSKLVKALDSSSNKESLGGNN